MVDRRLPLPGQTQVQPIKGSRKSIRSIAYEPLLKVEPQSDLDLTGIASTARFPEEWRGHGTAVAIQLSVIQKILDLHLERHGWSIVILVEAAVLASIAAKTPSTTVAALTTEITAAT